MVLPRLGILRPSEQHTESLSTIALLLAAAWKVDKPKGSEIF